MQKNNHLESFSSYQATRLILSLFGILILGLILNVGSVQAMSTQMDIGTRHLDVTTLQRYLSLNRHNYPSGLVTGYYGSSTQAGVQKFQVNQGIVSDGSPDTTGYGRVGPLTLARLNSLMEFTSQDMNTDYQSGSGDVSSPIMSQEVIAVNSNSATIRWNTNEAALSRVMYATNWPFLYDTALSVSTNAYRPTNEITLTGLQPNTTYYYVLESIDYAGNVTWTIYQSFKTR